MVSLSPKHRPYPSHAVVHSCRSDLACDMALVAVETVAMEAGDRKEIDIKRYAKVEKVCSHSQTLLQGGRGHVKLKEVPPDP